MNLTDATAVYAGTTEAQAVYYGTTKLWPFTGWQQLGADLLGAAANNQFGYAVATNAAGDRVAIGAPYNSAAGSNIGAVRVVDWDGTAWVTVGSEILGKNTIVGETGFGAALSMSVDGTILAASTISGYVRVYQWNGTAWAQKGADIYQLTGSPGTGQAEFGKSISLNSTGTLLAIGAPSGLSYSGYTRVYEWDGSAWQQLGGNILSEVSGDRSGWAVALSANTGTAVIGARYYSANGLNSGSVRVMHYVDGAWEKLGQTIAGTAAGDESGYSVAINADGTRLAIGARYHDQPSSNAGNTRIFQWDGTAWVQMGSDILGVAGNDWSGASVSMNAAGDIVAIGSERADTGGTDSGHVRVYQWNGTAWVQIGDTLDGASAGDNFSPVALNAAGTRLIAGGKFNDAAGSNAGHARVFEFV